MSKVIVTKIGKATKEGISFTFTKPIQPRGKGLAAKEWWFSWDTIGAAIVGDDYIDGLSVADMTKFRNGDLTL